MSAAHQLINLHEKLLLIDPLHKVVYVFFVHTMAIYYNKPWNKRNSYQQKALKVFVIYKM